MRRWNLPLDWSYWVGGGVVLCLGLLAFDRVFRLALGFDRAPLGRRLLALGVLGVFWLLGLAPVMQPADTWSLLIASLTIAAFLSEERRLLLSTLALTLAALNKETPFFFLPLLAYLEWSQRGWRRALTSCLLAPLPGLALYLWIHWRHPVSYGFPLDEALINWRSILGTIRHGEAFRLGGPDIWLWVFLAAFFAIGCRWRSLSPTLKAMTWASLLPLGIDLTFGYPTEFRIFVDKFPLLLPPLLAPAEETAVISPRDGVVLSALAVVLIWLVSLIGHAAFHLVR